ncbi:glycosyltransferase [Microbacterium sp. A588]
MHLSSPEVDLVIAVHDPNREIARAVGSVLSSSAIARVIVVCHNTPVRSIAERLGDFAADPRVVLVPLDDGIRSPSGPFNRGLELAEAPFVSIMGSDDELAPGAVDTWLRVAHEYSAEVVIPVVRYAGGARMPTPPTRPWRTGALDPIRDRLAYRTAPLGLVARERFGGLRMTPGLASGEDLDFSTRLWFSGASIARVRDGAEYFVHDDAERVTFTRRPVAEDLEAVRRLISDDWVMALPERSREAIAVKLWRLPVFGAVHYRAASWNAGDRVALADAGGELVRFASSALDVLSRADRELVRGILDPAVADDDLDGASRARRRFMTPAALIPVRVSRFGAREAPLRFAAATWLTSRH